MNARWHQAHRLPRGASEKERLAWHLAHAKACGCREMPASLRALASAQSKRAPDKTQPAKVAARASAIDPRFAKIVAALGHERGVTYGGKGFGSSALKIDDKIFAMLSSKGAFVVKLPKARVTELVEQKKGRYFDPGRGRLMKEWLDVTTAPARWLALAKEALAFGREG